MTLSQLNETRGVTKGQRNRRKTGQHHKFGRYTTRVMSAAERKELAKVSVGTEKGNEEAVEGRHKINVKRTTR